MPVQSLRWILVAGTGRMWRMSSREVLCARAIGEALARFGYGLIVGGWDGVDAVTAKSFAGGLDKFRPSASLSDVLIQVVPRGGQPSFEGGHLIYVEPGPAEWIEQLRYCDAVVLVGGVGGTLKTYRFALQERRPVFPIAVSGGDAKLAYDEIIAEWETTGRNWWGISRSAFDKLWDRKIKMIMNWRVISLMVFWLCAQTIFMSMMRIFDLLEEMSSLAIVVMIDLGLRP